MSYKHKIGHFERAILETIVVKKTKYLSPVFNHHPDRELVKRLNDSQQMLLIN